MKVKGIDFVGVAVSDMEAAKTFYGEALGLTCIGSFSENWVEYDAGNITLSLIKGEPEAIAKRLEPGPYAQNGVAFAVADVAVAVDELRRKGVTVTMDAQEFPPCFMATVQDPSGNYVWLHQRKDGSAG